MLHTEILTMVPLTAKKPAEQLMEGFIPPPAPQLPEPVSLDQWTTSAALRLQIRQMEVDNSVGRVEVSSHRVNRAVMLLGQCKVRVSNAEDELSAAKLALADAQCEYDIADRDNDWEHDALEMNRDQYLEERAQFDTERFERERAANAP